MEDTQVCDLSIRDAAARIQRHQLSPVELLSAYLKRIHELDPALGAYVTVTEDRAQADARRAEQEVMQGHWRGSLHGIPLGLKDVIETAGIRTTAGSRVLLDNVPKRDAAVAARLRAAGSVLLGKLMTHEFAIGSPRLSDTIAPARNPWNLEHVPGGSSSGAAAGLAARLCAGALGTDTGGSVRLPASFCGVVGFKPTQGLVSTQGVVPLSWTLDVVGPMARSVGDAAILLQAIVGYDPADPGSVASPSKDYVASLDGSLRGIRIGVPRALVESAVGLESEVLQAFHSSITLMEELGAEVRDIAIAHVEHAEPVLNAILFTEALAYHEQWLRARAHDYEGFWKRALLGIFYTGVEYVQAQRGRTVIRRGVDEAMTNVDLIATPTMPRTAPTFAEDAAHSPTLSNIPFTRLANIVGSPALSLPCGFDGRGLPVGLMLMGRPFEDELVLRAGNAYERETDWHLRIPSGFGAAVQTP